MYTSVAGLTALARAGAGNLCVKPREVSMGLNVQIVVDCHDPDFLAGFWAAALGYEKQWSWDEATTQDMLEGGLEPEHVNSHYAVIDPAGRVDLFQRVPERKQIKNRLHLDLEVGEERVEAMVEKLTALGRRPRFELSRTTLDHSRRSIGS